MRGNLQHQPETERATQAFAHRRCSADVLAATHSWAAIHARWGAEQMVHEVSAHVAIGISPLTRA